MMTFKQLVSLGMVAGAALVSFPAQAAGPGSIAGAIGTFGSTLNSIPLPMGGTIGGQSIQSGVNAVPGLSDALAKIPGLSAGVPLVGNITVNAALGIPGGISAFQQPLPGLGSLP